MCETGVLSCTGKLARVVLDNRGPLSPSEIAAEAHITAGEARKAVEELTAAGYAEPVCGLCESREEVFTLTQAGEDFDSDTGEPEGC
ncbi:MAG: MarR family transcriptional regulator [Halanaeroarchaeum sp.]